MKKSLIAILSVLFIFILLIPVNSYASSTSGKKAILIILDRVSLNDYTKYDLPNIKKLIDKGSIGLMNTKTAGSYTEPSSYLTIGTGTRASADGIGSLSFNGEESYEFGSANVLYRLYNGFNPVGGNIVNIGISSLIDSASKLDYKVTPGLLGELLKNNNIPVYVFGNSDTKSPSGISYDRYAALIAIDEKGIANGDISSNLLKSDNNSPYLIKADYDKLYNKFIEYSKSGGLIIIDPGDTSRADTFSQYASPDASSKYRESALKSADKFIGKILNNLDLSKDLLIIATPYPSSNDIKIKNLITPIIVAGPGYSGLTTSSTTKREGIIENIDIAPTILSYFNIKPPVEMLGHQIKSIKYIGTLNYLNNVDKMVVSTHNARPPVLKSYVLFMIIILILYILLLFLKREYLKYVKPIILGIMTVPLTLLVLPLLGPLSVYMNIAAIVLITAASVALIMRLVRNEMDMFMIISLVTAAAISLDLIGNSHLIKNSILGYDVIEGARFYGIGNEYMGVLIGSTTMGIMTLIEKFKNKSVKLIGIFVFLSVFLLMILPEYGAKVGGFITGFMAFGSTLLMLFGIKINRKTFAIMFILMILLLFLTFVVSTFVGTATHMSQTALIVKSEGISSLIKIFSRKLDMELTLIRYTIWSWVLIISIIIMFILSNKPTGILKNIFKKYKFIYYGFFGSIVGMLFALAFNDAGIVAAATMCIYVIPPLLILLENEM